jgi:carbon monoxide dehydrogenase subunit G
MNIEGQFVFEGITSAAVWNFLTDPGRIAQCLPGCEKLLETGDNVYEMTLKIKVGPVSGAFAGTIRVHELHPVSDFQMSVSGSGAPGFVKGEGRITLEQSESGAQVRYSGDASAGGVIASVGQRMIGGAARMVIDQFFKCAAKNLAAS